MSYAVRFTVPVYVEVSDEGVVTRVVVEDESLSEPQALVPRDAHSRQSGWTEEDEIPWAKVSQDDRDTYTTDVNRPSPWPGWDFGW